MSFRNSEKDIKNVQDIYSLGLEEGNQENLSTDGEKKSVMNNYSTSFNDQQDAPGFGGG